MLFSYIIRRYFDDHSFRDHNTQNLKRWVRLIITTTTYYYNYKRIRWPKNLPAVFFNM